MIALVFDGHVLVVVGRFAQLHRIGPGWNGCQKRRPDIATKALEVAQCE